MAEFIQTQLEVLRAMAVPAWRGSYVAVDTALDVLLRASIHQPASSSSSSSVIPSSRRSDGFVGDAATGAAAREAIGPLRLAIQQLRAIEHRRTATHGDTTSSTAASVGGGVHGSTNVASPSSPLLLSRGTAQFRVRLARASRSGGPRGISSRSFDEEVADVGEVTNITGASIDSVVSSSRVELRFSSPHAAPTELETVQQGLDAYASFLTSELRRVSQFYLRQARAVSSSVAACVDATKTVEKQTDRQRSEYAAACRETHAALSLLASYRDVNLAALRTLLQAVPVALGGARVSESSTTSAGVQEHQQQLQLLPDGAGGIAWQSPRQWLVPAFDASSVDAVVRGVPFAPQRRVSGLQLLSAMLAGAHDDAYDHGPRLRLGGAVGVGVARVSDLDPAELAAAGGGSDPLMPSAVDLGATAASSPPLSDLKPTHLSRGLSPLLAVSTALLSVCVVEFASLPQPLRLNNDGGSLASFHFTTSLAVLLMTFGFAVCVMAWEAAEVNYAYLLGLHWRAHWTGRELLRDVLLYVSVWLIMGYAFLRTAQAEIRYAEARSGGGSLPWGSSGSNGPPAVQFSYVWALLVWPALIATWIGKQLPLPADARRERWLLPTIWRIVRTPFLRVRFADFIVCTCLVTLGLAWHELQYVWCNVTLDDVSDECRTGRLYKIQALRLVPLLWRALQCFRNYRDSPAPRSLFPHVVNGVKYLLAVFALLLRFGLAVAVNEIDDREDGWRVSMLVLFLVVRSTDSTFRCVWDLTVDCGLKRYEVRDRPSSANNRTAAVTSSEEATDEKSGSFTNEDDDDAATDGDSTVDQADFEMLRNDKRAALRHARSVRLRKFLHLPWRIRPLLFPLRFYAAFAIVDIVVRWVWVLRYFMVEELTPHAQYIPILFLSLNILRRVLWLCVRVENEQVNNIELYKLSKQAPPPPPVSLLETAGEDDPSASSSATTGDGGANGALRRRRQRQQGAATGAMVEGGLDAIWDRAAEQFTLLSALPAPASAAGNATVAAEEEESREPALYRSQSCLVLEPVADAAAAAQETAAFARTVTAASFFGPGVGSPGLGFSGGASISFAALADAPTLVRFFTALPSVEQEAVIRVAAAGDPRRLLGGSTVPTAQHRRLKAAYRHYLMTFGEDGLPSKGTLAEYFATLLPELQVFALLSRVGPKRTLLEYAESVVLQHAQVSSSSS